MRFQLVSLSPKDDEESGYCDWSWCHRHVRPMGTFELTMTNGTKFETVFNHHYQRSGKKYSRLSIDSARNIYFDVSDIVDEISVYLHTSILLEKYN